MTSRRYRNGLICRCLHVWTSEHRVAVRCAAALTVGGAPLVETLIHQQADTFVSQVGAFFVSATPADIWVAVSMFQTIFDRQDGHNQAWFMHRQPFPVAGTLNKASVLLTEGLNDSMVPNNGTEALAWLLGPVPLLNPAPRAVTFLPIATAPLSANIDSRTTAALFRYVPGLPLNAIPPNFRGCETIA